MASSLKPFYFLRHGETDWNRLHMYTGSQDIPLNQTGEKQATEAADILKKNNIKHIVTSPLIRATKTAEIINKILKANVTVVEELSECCWGEYEGKPYSDNNFLQKWLDGNHFNGVEHVHDFEKRVMIGFNNALELRGQVLIIAHGAVYGAIQRIFGLPLINLKNCYPFFHRPPDEQNHLWSVYGLRDEYK